MEQDLVEMRTASGSCILGWLLSPKQTTGNSGARQKGVGSWPTAGALYSNKLVSREDTCPTRAVWTSVLNPSGCSAMRSMSQFLPTGSFLWLGNTLSALGPDSPTLVARPRRREQRPGEQQKPSGKTAVPGSRKPSRSVLEW